MISIHIQMSADTGSDDQVLTLSDFITGALAAYEAPPRGLMIHSIQVEVEDA